MINRTLANESTPLLSKPAPANNANLDVVLDMNNVEMSEVSNQVIPFEELPHNIIIHIATYLTLRDACRLSLVRNDINILINNSARRVHADNKLIPLMYEDSDGHVLPATYQFIFNKLKENHVELLKRTKFNYALLFNILRYSSLGVSIVTGIYAPFGIMACYAGGLGTGIAGTIGVCSIPISSYLFFRKGKQFVHNSEQRLEFLKSVDENPDLVVNWVAAQDAKYEEAVSEEETRDYDDERLVY